jgi:uncharacterized membrane protein
VRSRWIVVALLALGCGGGGSSGPTATGSTCPDGSTLSYENFGRDFMERYCTRCHSSELSRAERMGAPLFHDFDTFEGIFQVEGHVDEQAAAGPDATNRFMPPDGEMPTDEERRQLGEWIACEDLRQDQAADAGPGG